MLEIGVLHLPPLFALRGRCRRSSCLRARQMRLSNLLPPSSFLLPSPSSLLRYHSCLLPPPFFLLPSSSYRLLPPHSSVLTPPCVYLVWVCRLCVCVYCVCVSIVCVCLLCGTCESEREDKGPPSSLLPLPSSLLPPTS